MHASDVFILKCIFDLSIEPLNTGKVFSSGCVQVVWHVEIFGVEWHTSVFYRTSFKEEQNETIKIRFEPSIQNMFRNKNYPSSADILTELSGSGRGKGVGSILIPHSHSFFTKNPASRNFFHRFPESWFLSPDIHKFKKSNCCKSL